MAEEYMVQQSYAGKVLSKIPGMGASERTYSTFLNRIRADYFDMLTDKLEARGMKLTPQQDRAIAQFVNDVTGRSDLGRTGNNSAALLSQIFFSPRFVASRFKTILRPFMGFANSTPEVRKAVALEYARFASAMAAIYGLLHVSGVEIEKDPRSSIFGRFKIGNTWIDPLSGFAQAFSFLTRIVGGKTKTISGEVRDLRGEEVQYGQQNTSDIIGRFLRSKLGPVPGTAYSLVVGEDYMGNKITTPENIGKEFLSLQIPMAIKEVYSSMVEEGVPEGVAIGMLAILGEGVATIPEEESAITIKKVRR
jgi:hypothetical protein